MTKVSRFFKYFVQFMKLKFWLPPVVWAAIIFAASSFPTSGLPPTFPQADKLAHFIIYGILALLLHRAFRLERRYGPLTAVLLSILVASIYGALDEYHQSFIPTRSTDLLDWLADTLGAISASTCLALLRRPPRS